MKQRCSEIDITHTLLETIQFHVEFNHENQVQLPLNTYTATYIISIHTAANTTHEADDTNNTLFTLKGAHIAIDTNCNYGLDQARETRQTLGH